MLEILLDILFRILRALIYVGAIGTLIYFLLPWIFRTFVSPKFNAAYIYNAKDFEEATEKEVPEQENHPKLEYNKENGLYSISFGQNRSLIEGIVQVFQDNWTYTNQKSLDKKGKSLILGNIVETIGEDNLGKYTAHDFTYRLEGQDNMINAIIYEYPDQNFLTFELKFPYGLANTSRGDFKHLITAFPCFLNDSPNNTIFTYRHAIFCPPERKLDATSSPVVFYDEELNCFLLSSLDGFLNNAISETKHHRIQCGFQGELQEIPENASQKFILLFGKGINHTFEQLGDLLRKYHETEKKDPYGSIAVSHLSYWTDNGAYYYYQKEKGMSYEDTMVVVKDYFEEHNIPIQSYNFDSWWYLKYQSSVSKFFSTVFKPLYRIIGGGLFGNILRWEADPDHFSTDLATYYRERFKYPIIAHSRRWDARSPYLDEYEFEVDGDHAVPLKKDFWDWCMKHAKESGIEVYEQDWMKNQVNSISILREDFFAKEKWLNSMASAARDQDVDVFYCMMTPEMLLYSMKHPNIVMGRCSGDYNHRWPLSYRYVFCTQTCILFNAAGINPHQDVFRSSYERLGEHYPELKCLLEILTAGVVAPGDKKEQVNWPLLRKTCRDDGLLLKPDKAITANDLMFKTHKKYYICDTYTERKESLWRYVLIVNIWPKRAKEPFFTAEELGFPVKEFILYDFYKRNPIKVSKDEKIFLGTLNKYEYRYFVLCPLAKNGMALIGCPDKFVTCSKKQFPKVSSTENSLTFTVEDIKGSELEILVFSNTKPSSIQFEDGKMLEEGNSKNAWKYISATHKVLISLQFENLEKTTLTIQN